MTAERLMGLLLIMCGLFGGAVGWVFGYHAAQSEKLIVGEEYNEGGGI